MRVFARYIIHNETGKVISKHFSRTTAANTCQDYNAVHNGHTYFVTTSERFIGKP